MKYLVWSLAIVSVIALCGVLLWAMPTPQTRIVRVVTVAADLYFGTTTHYIGTTTGEVIRVRGDSWALARVDHCYRVAANTSDTGDITEVPCP